MNNLFLTFSLFALIFVSSCKKGEMVSNQDKIHEIELRTEKISSGDIWSLAKNDNNSSDSLGLIHNLLLDYLFSKKKTNVFNVAYSYAKDYFADERGYTYNFDVLDSFIHDEQVISNIKIINDINSFKELSSLYHDKNLSDQYNQYLENLFGILDNGMNIYAPENERACIEEYLIVQIKHIEQTIIDDQYLINLERERLLGSASIMRYSLVYWSIKESQNVAKLGKGWIAVIRAGADVLGGVIGASIDSVVPTGVATTLGAGIASRLADDLLN